MIIAIKNIAVIHIKYLLIKEVSELILEYALGL